MLLLCLHGTRWGLDPALQAVGTSSARGCSSLRVLQSWSICRAGLCAETMHDKYGRDKAAAPSPAMDPREYVASRADRLRRFVVGTHTPALQSAAADAERAARGKPCAWLPLLRCMQDQAGPPDCSAGWTVLPRA